MQTEGFRKQMAGFWFRCFFFPLLLSSMVLITGCGGCNDDEGKDKKTRAELKKEKEEKKKEKPKDNFESRTPIIFPGTFPKPIDPDAKPEEIDEELVKERRLRNLLSNRTKPGHWVNVHFPLIANNFDANGRFTAKVTSASGAPVRILGTDYYSYAERPVSLAKGQWKNLETTVYLPRRDTSFRSANVEYTLGGRTGVPQVSIRQPHPLMHPGQFHFVVLTKRPDVFRYLNKLDCIAMPDVGTMESRMSGQPFYEVVISDPADPLPLSRNAMTWTTTAYLLWDDILPEELDSQQQQAMLDWLHFGGQIILSGPDSLDKLRNCFLTPYLPATFESSVNLTQDDFDELNASWSVSVRGIKQLYRVGSELLGVAWKPHPDASYIEGTGELAIERMVGRGRIVMTKFPLNSKSPTVSWRSFSSFFNGCLLRKPARKFYAKDFFVDFKWTKDLTSPYDPLLGSTVRFTSRDLPAAEKVSLPGLKTDGTLPGQNRIYGNYDVDPYDMQEVGRNAVNRNSKDHWHYGGYKHDDQSGVAAWDDYSGISSAARVALNTAAGIDPPSPGFVLKLLTVYVLVLVPLNWVLFRLIGKVEWAWIAAPIIAVGGAFAVVKMATLDIGFVRSQTQLALLELHGDYPRGHLTEYSAMYTSLSTRYAMSLENSTGAALPFPSKTAADFRADPDKIIRGVRQNQTVDNRMEEFLIQSNFTGMLHTEMVLDSQGTFSLKGTTLSNTTALDLSSAGVLRRTASGGYQLAWIGDLESGASTELAFESVDKQSSYEKWFETSEFSYWTNEKIWEKHFGESIMVSFDVLDDGKIPQIKDFEEFKTEMAKTLEKNSELDQSGLNPSTPITKERFLQVFDKLYPSSVPQLNLGRMLFGIKSHLQMGPGEDRLIGFTGKKITENQLIPKATQLHQLTLVLVHLNRSPLLKAVPDKNHWGSFLRPEDFDFEFSEKSKEAEEAEDDEEDPESLEPTN